MGSEARKRPVAVCRASYNGMWVSGELRPERKTCVVSFLGVSNSYDRYQVLENVDNGARLAWVRWNTSTVVPAGAVSCGDGVATYIARHNAADLVAHRFTHHIGKLDPKYGFGKISIVNKVMYKCPELTV